MSGKKGNPNGNTQNLIPLTERSPDEAKAIRQKGGKASNAAQKKKKEMREVVQALLSCKCSKSMEKTMKERGIKDDDMLTNRMVLAYRLMGLAMDVDNPQLNIPAINELLKLAGESSEQADRKESTEHMTNSVDDDPFSVSIKQLLEMEVGDK